MPDLGRPPEVSALTPAELERTRRDLAIAMALLRPNSPAAIPITVQLTAIDTELARRTPRPQLPCDTAPGLVAEAVTSAAIGRWQRG